MTISLQDMGLAVKRLQWRHHREASTRLQAALGLSLPQWDVLRHLHQRPEASLHELAQLTFQTDQSMGALASRMIGRGLLERAGGPGRAVRHVITPAGQRARLAGSDIMDGVLRESLGGLTAPQRATLYRLLTEAAGSSPVSSSTRRKAAARASRYSSGQSECTCTVSPALPSSGRPKFCSMVCSSE